MMVGTTHFVNAVIQRKHLSKVAAIRIGAPATRTLLPMCDWPHDLTACVHADTWLIEGGNDYDGRRFVPLNMEQARRAVREIRARGLRYVAVTSMFSPIDSSDEEQVGQLLRDEFPACR